MRLDPFGLTGPPTSKKQRKEKRREEKEEEEQQLWLLSSSSLSSSSLLSSTSFIECARFVYSAYRSCASSRSYPSSIRDRVVDDDSVFAARHHDEARYHDGYGPDEKAGTATAFRVSRDSASRGVVRARTRDRHEDHEDGDDNDGDADADADAGVLVAGASRARTRILRVDRPSPRRRTPRSARGARRRARRRRGSGPIPEEGPDVAASAVSFVDVLAYTAYSDDRDDDGDEGRAYCEQKRIHGGLEEVHDEHEENGNDDNARVSVPSNSRDEHKDANENAPREDYIRTEVDAINRGIPKGDQWASPSLGKRKDRRCERVDGYDREHPTVDEEFDGLGRRKGRGRSGWRCSDNTAWFQKPITRKNGREGGGGGGRREGTRDKPRTRRSYYRLLLFILYFLAWPLLCSTSPSGHLASTFAQNPTLSHAKNPAQRGNATLPDTSLFSSSTVIVHSQQPQQYVQGSDYNTDDNERHRHHQQQQQEQQSQQQQQKERKQKREQLDQEEEPESHPYNKYTWEVNQVNPWLSACDLAGPAPADLQGSCGPPEVPKYCPIPCKDDYKIIERGKNGEEKKKEEQCLYYLEESHKNICRGDFSKHFRKQSTLRENRYWYMSRLRLRHCCEHAVVNALAPGKGGPLEDVLSGNQKCEDALDKLLLVDALASRLHCEFEEVLARYDCAQPYSVIHNCTHCKEAYRKWVCSSLVPYFAHGGPSAEIPQDSWNGTRLRPCLRSFCQTVEQRCPYLLPGDRAPAYPTQYAGEPTFLCRDPNIPETGEQAARALHNNDDDECCFHVCAEDEPASGICANCTEPWRSGRAKDPATAPQCEINPPQSGSTGQQYPGSQAGQPEASTERGFADDGDDQNTSTVSSSSSTPASSITTTGHKDSSFCGSGRIGSISSASSPGRSSPPIVLQLLWLCSILISLPANALHHSASWSPSGFLRLIKSGVLLPGAFVLKRTFNDLRASFGPRSAGICRLAVVRCLLFVLGMPRRAVMKCRRRGWWWWRSWRRSSSRHFRWKFSRRSGVATWRSVLRDASISTLELFLKYVAKCRCRDWWWLWRRWRKCGSTNGRDAGFVPRRKRTTVYGARRRRGRRRYPSGILETDVVSSAKSTSRKDPP